MYKLSLVLSLASSLPPAAMAHGAAPSKEAVEFFESRVRPVLVEQCYPCHSAGAKKIGGELLLDSRDGWAKGGKHGPAVKPGEPAGSRLIEAIHWNDPDLQMPPKRKLSDAQIETLERWVAMGAPDPRDAAPTVAAAKKPIGIEAGKSWWAFQPVREIDPPAVKDVQWSKKKIDRFIAAGLDEKQLKPSPPADRRTLVQRAYLDLTGLRPMYEQVEAFANDASSDAYERLIDELLDSPRYGEQWGRHWLDVARYGEDNPTTEATNPPYPFAWRYRDWVIESLNRNVPYDRFVKLQMSADLMPDTPRKDLAALGFLGAAPIYHKDGRLSREVIETLYTDDWDERVDTVTRGVLGLSVACARCHDHKFDPITTKDYYSLAGVFASTAPTPRPMAEIDPLTETRFMAAAQRIFYLSYVANLLRAEPGSKPVEAKEKVHRFIAEMEYCKEEMAYLRADHPEMYAYLERLAKRPPPYPGEPKPPATPEVDRPRGDRRQQRRGASDEPFYNAVFDAGVWIDGSDPDLTHPDVEPGKPRDMNVLPGGNVAKPGEPAPRRFLEVLSKGDSTFHRGSGRLELANRMFDDAAPLAARVIVNRVWAWHFGKPLVATPSDFGAQGEKPTHPQLLDDLAARFIKSGWSLKWLHREIMLSAAYQQSSRPRVDAAKVDPSNRLIWRMNPRRLDVEMFRDTLLQASGKLDAALFGVSMDLDQPQNVRRTIYSRISRGRANPLLQIYDFPEATQHSPGRETTTTPLQQLFVMNSAFVQDQAKALAKLAEKEDGPAAQVRLMYRRTLSRQPTDAELKLAQDYLASGDLPKLAQALLSTTEVIFWP